MRHYKSHTHHKFEVDCLWCAAFLARHEIKSCILMALLGSICATYKLTFKMMGRLRKVK